MIEDDEIDSPEYYDLYEDLNERLCEENKAPKEDKVCCSGDEIQVGSFLIKKNIQFKLTWWESLEKINIDKINYLE